MSSSVVVVSYRRQARLGEILGAWLKETPDVWLCDCSENGFVTELPVNIVRFRPDPGNRVRHAVALLAGGDVVIKADDDVKPRPGLAADFVSTMRRVGPAILGIHGRRFLGPDYYRQTQMIVAQKVAAPVRVDFVGVITAAPRELLPMDLKGCASEVEDLYWQMAKYPKAPKYIISSDKFEHLLDVCKDAGRLCGNRPSRAVRQEFYKRHYMANSARRGPA